MRKWHALRHAPVAAKLAVAGVLALAPAAHGFNFLYDVPTTDQPIVGSVPVVIVNHENDTPPPEEDTPEVPDTPGTPETPENPNNPENPGNPGEHMPEPASVIAGLIGLGVAGVAARRRRIAK
jgi:hypothetical protein